MMTCESIRAIWPRTTSLFLNLMFVYALEYACIGCFADRMAEWKKEASSDQEKETYMVKNYFTILNFAYQVGVCCARSSLLCFKINRVWILTVL